VNHFKAPLDEQLRAFPKNIESGPIDDKDDGIVASDDAIEANAYYYISMHKLGAKPTNDRKWGVKRCIPLHVVR
jgi:hypothetical protein